MQPAKTRGRAIADGLLATVLSCFSVLLALAGIVLIGLFLRAVLWALEPLGGS